tara:strand:- start:4295 stop:4585 length:291 start_codon:yes stop_codon:yes gene_type:complete
MKITKHSLDHIELVSSGDTALFEIRLVVAMNDWTDEAEDMGALDWLMNLLSLASEGTDITTGAQEFLKSMMTLSEERVHLCKVEKVDYNIDEIGDK